MGVDRRAAGKECAYHHQREIMSRITVESLRAALPGMDGERSLPSLEGPIVIHRDG